AQGNSPAFRQGPRAILWTGLTGHQDKDAASTQDDPRILPHFHDARMAARGPGYFVLIKGEAKLDSVIRLSGRQLVACSVAAPRL
ncbi:MAG: hypothetical protein WBP81_01645, partial [Solirubrobacteraceae bacterium]